MLYVYVYIQTVTITGRWARIGQTDTEMDRLIEKAVLNSQIRDVEVSEYPPGQ